MATAKRLLIDEGLDALTHARVAIETGVSRMTLYRHWPTRLAMLKDALSEAAEARHTNVSGDLRRDVRTEMQLIRQELLSPTRGRLLAALVERAQLDDGLAALRDESVAKACSGLETVLRAGLELGTLPADLDVGAATAWLVGPCVYQLLGNGKALTSSFVDEVVETFLCRFCPPAAPR
jgi:AcrR family transcriptional regulator